MRMAQIGTLEHFQIGEDWESYEEHLQQYFKANEITDADKKLAVFLTVIGNHLYKLLCNLLSPSKLLKSHDERTAVLKQQLVPKPIVIPERLKLHKCIQVERLSRMYSMLLMVHLLIHMIVL